MTTEETKKCPFCAEEIKAEAIVCKHCGRDIAFGNHQTNNTTNSVLKFILHPFVIIVIIMYASTRIENKLGNLGVALFCGFWSVVFIVTSLIRDKLITDKERKSEKEDAEYWEQHGR